MSQILQSPNAGHPNKKMGLLPLEFGEIFLSKLTRLTSSDFESWVVKRLKPLFGWCLYSSNYITKGQLISKCLFGIFNSPKKWTKKFDFTTMVTSSRIVFVRCLGELKTQKRHFEINWPLGIQMPQALAVSRLHIEGNAWLLGRFPFFLYALKVIYSRYSKHWLSTVA